MVGCFGSFFVFVFFFFLRRRKETRMETTLKGQMVIRSGGDLFGRDRPLRDRPKHDAAGDIEFITRLL